MIMHMSPEEESSWQAQPADPCPCRPLCLQQLGALLINLQAREGSRLWKSLSSREAKAKPRSWPKPKPGPVLQFGLRVFPANLGSANPRDPD